VRESSAVVDVKTHSVQEESELQGWENGDMREVADLWVALEADACGV
jgi:hypothetical protein